MLQHGSSSKRHGLRKEALVCQTIHQSQIVPMKNQITKRMTESLALLRQFGLSSMQELMNSCLLVHISYGNKEGDGESLLVRPQEIVLLGDSMTIELERTPLEIHFSNLTGGSKMLGEFENLTSASVLQITQLEFRKEGGWRATYVDDQNTCGALGSENVEVEILP